MQKSQPIPAHGVDEAKFELFDTSFDNSKPFTLFRTTLAHCLVCSLLEAHDASLSLLDLVFPMKHLTPTTSLGLALLGSVRGDVRTKAQLAAVSPVPRSEPITSTQLQYLVDLVTSSRNTVVMTGAGVSTESGIPDYRGPAGAYTFGYTPMTHQKFMGTDRARSRYWARNFAAWEEFSSRTPNELHWKLTALEKLNWIDWIITQNVDRLHHKSGSKNIIELHGTTYEVVCTNCGVIIRRPDFQAKLSGLNPLRDKEVRRMNQAKLTKTETATESLNRDPALVRPDGDVELHGAEKGFRFPSCPECDGILKPDVVFFGDNVPKSRAEKCLDICGSCEVLLVVGSSVRTYSAYRLAKAARNNNARIAIVNIGETRADDIADVKIECVASEVLSRLSTHPALLTPRVV